MTDVVRLNAPEYNASDFTQAGTSMYVSYHCVCVLKPLNVSSCHYICVLTTLYMCPHTTIYVSLCLYMCPHTTIYVSSYHYIMRLNAPEYNASDLRKAGTSIYVSSCVFFCLKKRGGLSTTIYSSQTAQHRFTTDFTTGFTTGFTAGFEHHDLLFTDCSTPPDNVVEAFLQAYIYVPSYILLYMCPHTYCCVCVLIHTAIYVSSYILLYMCL